MVYKVEKINNDLYVSEFQVEKKDCMELLENSTYIVRKYLHQHKAIAKLNSSSVNTLRTVTRIGKGNMPHVFTHFIKEGKFNEVKDNTFIGGVVVPVNENGYGYLG